MAPRSEYLSHSELFEPEDLNRFLASSPSFRARLYPSDTTLVAAVYRKLTGPSCLGAVEQLYLDRAKSRQTAYSLKTSSFVRAKKRLSLDAVTDLTRNIGSSMTQETPREWCWKWRSVKFIDGSTIGMADAEANREKYPQHSAHRKKAVATRYPELGYCHPLNLGQSKILYDSLERKTDQRAINRQTTSKIC